MRHLHRRIEKLSASQFNIIRKINPCHFELFEGGYEFKKWCTRQRILSTPYAVQAERAEYARHGVPAGVIVMWSGNISDIPSGWILCDGKNGTPNLTDRFVKGVPNDEGETNPGTTGGTKFHSHGAGDYRVPATQPVWGYRTGNYESAGVASPNLTVAASKDPPIYGNSSSSSHLPPYYELAFIMKLKP